MNSWNQAVGVVKNCLKAGVGEFVVCAGARNAALLEALARAEAAGLVRVWRHFEERSAGFFALGRTMETAQPCAVVTTSGTAVAELLPAVIEAYYQARPARRDHGGPASGVPRDGCSADHCAARDFWKSRLAGEFRGLGRPSTAAFQRRV